MLESIKNEDIFFIEHLYDSLCVAEAFFTNYDNLSLFSEGKLGHIRLGQIPLLSQEYMIAHNPKLGEKENFALKMGAGKEYVLGGRNFGKTLCEKIDMLTSLMLLDGWPMGLTSYDAVHIRGVMEPVLSCLDTHNIFKHFLLRKVKSPTYFVTGINNSTIEGINMNITAQTPGSQFFAKHLKKLWIEEHSFETDEVYNKRVDSRHELGCIERSSGMCNFIKNSPAGRIFYDRSLRPYVVNLPQYVNPFWDDTEKKKAAKKFGGEQSIGFRIYVRGEVVEEGLSVFDLARIRPFYKEGKVLKTVEILKSNFAYYQQLLDVLERPGNVEQAYLCADIGEAAPSELIVLFKVGEKFKFIYSITLQNLKDSEQFAVFDYIISKLKINLVGIDTTDGTGRAIYRALEEKYPKENLVWCFTPDTDILTNSGWKKINNVLISDQVLTLNPKTNKSYYTNLMGLYERDYVGNLISYDAERLKFLVTPDHSFYFKSNTMMNRYIFDKASNLKGGESFKRDLGKFQGKKLSFIKIKGQRYNKSTVYQFETNNFLKLLGWYLAEGVVSPENTIVIYQNLLINKDKYNNICEILDSLNIHYIKLKDCISFNNKIIANWIKSNCYDEGRIKYKTIYNCYNKKIPIYIKNLAPSHLINLFETLILGDGWVSNKGQKGYRSSSKQLADDVQEIALKLGLVATIKCNLPSQQKVWSKSLNKVMTCNIGYTVLICKNKNSIIKYNKISKIPYLGKVYDVEVLPFHLIYVRYKGKSFWSGNCAFNEKISVEFAKDEKGQIIYQGGEPTYIEEFVTDWSVKHLKDILYDGKIEIPEDAYKLDTQLNSVRVFQSGTRLRYELTSEEDHLFQAFQVFSIVHWMNEFNLLQPIKNKIFCKTGV